MGIDEFRKLAIDAIVETDSSREDYDYEIECIIQFLIPKLSEKDIHEAINEYKKIYKR